MSTVVSSDLIAKTPDDNMTYCISALNLNSPTEMRKSQRKYVIPHPNPSSPISYPSSEWMDEFSICRWWTGWNSTKNAIVFPNTDEKRKREKRNASTTTDRHVVRALVVCRSISIDQNRVKVPCKWAKRTACSLLATTRWVDFSSILSPLSLSRACLDWTSASLGDHQWLEPFLHKCRLRRIEARAFAKKPPYSASIVIRWSFVALQISSGLPVTQFALDEYKWSHFSVTSMCGRTWKHSSRYLPTDMLFSTLI